MVPFKSTPVDHENDHLDMYLHTHVISTTRRHPRFSVFSSGDTDLISRDVGKAQRLRLTGTEELTNRNVLTSTKEMTSEEELTSIKDLNSTSTNVLSSTRELTSIKELTSTSTKKPINTKESMSIEESTSLISTRHTDRHSRWSLSRIFQTGLLHNTRYLLVTLTCQSLWFGFCLPCKCIFLIIPCSLTC